MEQTRTKPAPWLVAAWPGMGNVAIIAAGYLVHQFKMKQVALLPWRNYFDVNDVAVKGGIVGPARLPRGMFFRWENPAGRDLVVFLAEAQPARATLPYCHDLLNMAAAMGVERVATFASMATDLRPGQGPRVIGVATDTKTLDELTRAEVTPLADGQIGGLNGVLLGAAAARGMPGFCLLAEIPAFAAAVPNPAAARAALSVFGVMSSTDINLQELNQHAAAMDKALIEAAERAGGQEAIEPQADPEEPEEHDAPEPPVVETPGPESREHIEEMFDGARRDLSKSGALKEELDRLGVFKDYEDRFLDLFRRAG
jgi:predicted ATP-grasp superfamily ATP-dependent carboligase